jgi:hypothetical protein
LRRSPVSTRSYTEATDGLINLAYREADSYRIEGHQLRDTPLVLKYIIAEETMTAFIFFITCRGPQINFLKSASNGFCS